MCVIIVQPTNTYLTKEVAKKNWDINDDGGGFAYFDGDDYVIYKTFNFNDFWGKFERARSTHRDRPFLVHFRIATHGSLEMDNVHPFLFPDGSAVMAHNGILKGVPEEKGGRSDTRMFIDEVVPEIGMDWYKKPYLSDMVAEWIDWNKFAILDQDGIYIINEDKGDWYEGMWFSNTYGLPFGADKKNKTTSYSSKYTSQKQLDWGSDWNYYEDGYSSWWDQNDKVTSIYGKKEEKTGPKAGNPSYETKRSFELLREKSQLPHPLQWDEKAGVWFCRGCFVDLDDYTGECECWDSGCKTCNHLIVDCDCDPDIRDVEYSVDWTDMYATNGLEQF